MLRPSEQRPEVKTETALVSYDALSEFKYNQSPKRPNVPYAGKLATRNDKQLLEDWNRALGLERQKAEGTDIQIYILDEKGMEILKPLPAIVIDFSAEEKAKYGIGINERFKEEKVPAFINIEGLRLFWTDYLFRKVPKENKTQL